MFKDEKLDKKGSFFISMYLLNMPSFEKDIFLSEKHIFLIFIQIDLRKIIYINQFINEK